MTVMGLDEIKGRKLITFTPRIQDHLTPGPRVRTVDDHGSTGKIKLPPRKRTPKGPREAHEASIAARRFIRAVGRKVAHGDPEDLVEIQALARAVDQAMHTAIIGLRNYSGRSDAEIAKVLKTTRQAVSQRFPRGAS